MSEASDWPPNLTRRKLDLLDTFCGHAQALNAAAHDGTRAHRTGNIAESGDPFEKNFRELLAGSLPPSFQVSPGYFFDAAWDLSPQQDLMICNVEELVQFPPAKDLQQRYVPLTCTHVIGQLKNTASKDLITKALDQCAKTIETIDAMRQASAQDRLGRPYQEPPISVLAFGKGGNRELVDGLLKNFSRPLPHYLLMLEPGLVYSRRPNPLFFDDPHVSFIDQRNGGRLYACTARDTTPEKQSGAALLWTVFAVLSKINFDRGNNLAMAPLVFHVENQYPIFQATDTTAPSI